MLKKRLQQENDRLRKEIGQAKQLFAGEMKAMEAQRAADQEAFQKQMSDLLIESQKDFDALRLSMVCTTLTSTFNRTLAQTSLGR